MSVFNSNQHFAMNPINIDMQRSTFDRSNTHKTTFDSGKLVPIFLEEVLPGDTFNLQYSYICRLATPLFPTMDTANLDVYFFFVPTRIIWDDFKKFMGENDNAWIDNQQEIFVPQVISDNNGAVRNSYSEDELAAYFGVPCNVRVMNAMNGINALPFRAYAKIWNDWFRDQNTQKTIFYSTSSANLDMSNYAYNDVSKPDAFYASVQYGKALAPLNKYHDYFTSCLPGPQKGEPVKLPLTGNAPITINGKQFNVNFPAADRPCSVYDGQGLNRFPLRLWRNGNAEEITSGQAGSGNYWSMGLYTQGSNSRFCAGKSGVVDFRDPIPANISLATDIRNGIASANVNVNGLTGSADLSNVTAATINELRQAFQIQRLLEKDARGGTRYIEIIRSHFGVISPDARLQRSEYLGGGRNPITIEQVLQTSSTTSDSPLGQTGAFSLTGDNNSGFVKSFTEHGYIIGVCGVRVQHSYGQGLSKLWSRRRKYDYYWPALANIGEQPVYKKEIYFNGLATGNEPNATNEQVFGYNEAWADYRYKLNQVSGKFNPKATQTLKAWTYVDDYTNAPTLSNEWMQENKINISQTLAVQNQPQFIADFYFKNKATRPMPVYSIPGLIDHN